MIRMTLILVAASTAMIVEGAALGAQTTSNPVTPPFDNVMRDNGTIVAGGTAQYTYGGAVISNGYEIVNSNTNGDTCYIADGGVVAAPSSAGSIGITAGGSYTTPAYYRSNSILSIECPTTGDKYIAKRW